MLSDQEIDPDQVALAAVRKTEKLRLAAIRINDTNVMEDILDEKFIYISARGQIFDKRTYITAVHSHGLTYSDDVDLTETGYRSDGDLVILVGQMRGHARIEGEQDVYNQRNMRVWRKRERDWKLLAWQSSAMLGG